MRPLNIPREMPNSLAMAATLGFLLAWYANKAFGNATL
jgi:hypothetical protein